MPESIPGPVPGPSRAARYRADVSTVPQAGGAPVDGVPPLLRAIVGPIHGFLYMGYLLLTADLAYRDRWPVGRAVLVALAGTIPFVSFVAERKITRPLRDAT